MLDLRNFFYRFYPFNDYNTIFLNADGSILTWEKFHEKKTKLRKEQTVGKSYSVLFGNNNHDQSYFNNLLEIAGSKGSIAKPLTVKMPNGKQKQVKLRLEAIKNEEGEVL